jgi:hypothetical protein
MPPPVSQAGPCLPPKALEDDLEQTSEQGVGTPRTAYETIERQAVAQGAHGPSQIARVDRGLDAGVLESLGQPSGELRDSGLADRCEAAREGGVPRGVQRELEVQEVPVALVLERRADVRGDGGEGGSAPTRSFDGLAEFAAAPLDPLLVEAQEQLLLPVEVRVDGASGEPRRLRDRPDGRAMEPALGEDARRSVQELPPRLGAGLPPDSLGKRHADMITITIE